MASRAYSPFQTPNRVGSKADQNFSIKLKNHESILHEQEQSLIESKINKNILKTKLSQDTAQKIVQESTSSFTQRMPKKKELQF